MIFPEAMTELAMYRRFADAVKVPVLANITEFGATPLFTVDELRGAGVAIALYPLSAFRAMNKAALERLLRRCAATARSRAVVDTMQTRAELYDYLGYHAYEAEARRAVRQGAMSAHPSTGQRASNDDRSHRARQAEEIGRACPASSPATPRCARSAAPATTCTIAATTSSTSPTPANSRRSPTCWCTASCRRRRARRLQDEAAGAARHSGARSRSCSSRLPASAHPMDVMRTAVSALGTRAAGEGRPRHRGRARHRRPPDGVARLDAALLVSLDPQRRRIDVETDDDSIGGHFLHLLHGKRRRRRGCARCTPRSSSTPSTSSTRRRSPAA